MLRTLCLAATTAAALTVLVGCSDDEPTSSPPPASTTTSPSEPSTPTTDPGPVEPTLPPAAKKNGKAGAVAFVEYYWDIVDYAQATGDTARLGMLQSDSCDTCSAGRDWIDNVHSAGGRIVGGRVSVLSAFAGQAPSGPTDWIVHAKVKTSAGKVRGADDLNDVIRATTSTLSLTVAFNNGHWVMNSWRSA